MFEALVSCKKVDSRVDSNPAFWCFCVPSGAGSKTKHGCLSRVLEAGEGVRTLDIQLGKLTLYQLSYARENK